MQKKVCQPDFKIAFKNKIKYFFLNIQYIRVEVFQNISNRKGC